VTLASGARATSRPRTALDLAAGVSLLDGIVAVSSLRSAGEPLDTFESVLERAGRFTGVATARRALRRSIDGAESVLEILTMVRCEDLGFAAPELQVEVLGVDGARYRVDFAWRRSDGRWIVAESDGRVKYRHAEYLEGRSAEQAVWDEKRREDAIRPVVAAFVRFTWSDAWNGAGLERRLLAAGVPRPRIPRPLTA